MSAKYLHSPGLVLSIWLAACSGNDIQTVLPEPRPLGREYQTPRPRDLTLEVSTTKSNEPAGVLTLRQALAAALLQNPELAAFAWEVRAGEARTLQAGLFPNPEFGIDVENFGGSGDLQGFDAPETTIALSQLIELGGKRLKRRRLAALERDLDGWDYETKRLDVFTQVAEAFTDVLSAQEGVEVNKDLVRLAEQVRNAVAERVKTGKVSPVEETRARVTLSTSRIALERAKRDLEAARKRLVATWGGTSPTFERAEGTLAAITAIPPLGQLAQRVAQNPDIARWVVEMARRRASVDLEEARRIPDPTITGGFRHFAETGDNAIVMGLSIPLPVFDRNQGGVLEARSQFAKAREARRAAEVQVRAALGETYAALSAAYTEAIALKSDVLPGAQRAFDSTSEGFRQGKFGFLEVLDAQRTLFEARGQYVQVLADYHKAVAEVERLIGEPLAGGGPMHPKQP